MAAYFKKILNFFYGLLKKIFSKGETPVEPFEPIENPGEVIVYYGCPNSKNVRKLQTEKKKI